MSKIKSLPQAVVVISSVLGLQCDKYVADAFSNDKTLSFETNISDKIDTISDSNISININKYNEWNKYLEKRFDELLVKKYTNVATPDELNEFAELQQARSSLKYPMTADEIIAEKNREEATTELIRAIEKYNKYVG